MAAMQSDFNIPSWEGNNLETEKLSQAVFQSIPSTVKIKRKQHFKKDLRSTEVQKKGAPTKAKGLLLADDYDNYLSSLDPSERLTALLRKFENDKSKSGANLEKDETPKKKRKKNKDHVDIKVDTFAPKEDATPKQKRKKTKGQFDIKVDKVIANEDAIQKEPFDIRGKTESPVTIKDSEYKELSKSVKKNRKKAEKQNGKNVSDNGFLKEKGCKVLMGKEDCCKTCTSSDDVMDLKKGRKGKTKKLNRSINTDVDVNAKSSRDSENCNGSDSKKRKNLKLTKDKVEVERREPKSNFSVIIENSKDKSLELERGKLMSELSSSSSKKSKGRVDFKSKLEKKLHGGQFRYINEQLYTLSSNKAYEMFTKEPSLFDVYHKGFQSQVQSWPQNPIDLMIQDLSSRSEDLVVADMGCGDAKIAQSVKQKVYSFDLVAQNRYTIACDMSQVPLEKESVDVVIFCLSLMGKNIGDFLMEANRILKLGGTLKIAEVVSRFDNVGKFLENMSTFGFSLLSKDTTNKMFLLMDFKKTELPSTNVYLDVHLKPCLYKKR